MKKTLFIITVLLVTIFVSAFLLPNPYSEVTASQKNPACGYVIIEFGKGIDCNGDTIKLVKKNGIQVRALQK